MKELVSIIIPVYNAERYVGRCIDSILSQTYDKLDIIIVNDGSKDNSLNVIKKYDGNPHVSIVNIPNGGVVNARNTGLKIAKGKYLTFVDADDYLPIDALELMVKSIESSGADIVIGGYTLDWEKDGHKNNVLNKKDFSTPDEAISYCLNNGETFLPVKLYLTSLFKDSVKIPFDVCFMEDTIGTIQYLSHCEKVAILDRSIYFYFKNEGTASMTLRPQSIFSMFKVADFLMDYYPYVGKYGKKAIITQVGKLLYKTIGYADRIKEGRLWHNNLSKRYIGFSRSRNFQSFVIGLSIKSFNSAFSFYRGIEAYNKLKNTCKRYIWRMIH